MQILLEKSGCICVCRFYKRSVYDVDVSCRVNTTAGCLREGGK